MSTFVPKGLLATAQRRKDVVCSPFTLAQVFADGLKRRSQVLLKCCSCLIALDRFICIYSAFSIALSELFNPESIQKGTSEISGGPAAQLPQPMLIAPSVQQPPCS